MDERETVPGVLLTRLLRPALGALVCVILTTSIASAQYVSRLGRFKVDQIQGCAPFTVTITATNLTAGNDCASGNCFMTFEGTQQQNTYTHTYNTPGTFKLSVLYQNTGADDIEITVLQNIKPEFELYTCAGNKVSIKITDRTYDKYFIDYGDGSPVVTIPSGNNQVDSHAYAASGNFNISIHGQKLNAADNCFPMVKAFTALAVLPTPKINTLTSIDPNRLKLDFSAAPNIQLHLEIAVNNSATFQLFQTLYAVSTDTVRNITLDQNYYCFRLSAYNVCTGANTYSNTICSQLFTATAQADLDKLAWQTSGDPISTFSFNRNQSPYLSIPAPAQSYDDVDVTCQTNYCYQLISNYTNGSKSISLEKCVEAFTKKIPSAIVNASAVVSAAGVKLSWIQDPKFTTTEYFILRNQSGGSFQSIDSSPTTSYTDAAYTTNANFCYVINYSDLCAIQSPNSSKICPVRLSGTLDKANAVTLTWNSYKGWASGVSGYTIEKRDQGGSVIKTFNVTAADTVFLDNAPDPVNQVVSYQVTATPQTSGLTPSVSNGITLIKETNIYWPTAFTPDHNNTNDTFTVRGFFIQKMEINIFNRWGALVFSTDKDEAWNGSYAGKTMPNDTYVWTAKGTDLAGRNFSASGTVILMTP